MFASQASVAAEFATSSRVKLPCLWKIARWESVEERDESTAKPAGFDRLRPLLRHVSTSRSGEVFGQTPRRAEGDGLTAVSGSYARVVRWMNAKQIALIQEKQICWLTKTHEMMSTQCDLLILALIQFNGRRRMPGTQLRSRMSCSTQEIRLGKSCTMFENFKPFCQHSGSSGSNFWSRGHWSLHLMRHYSVESCMPAVS